MNLSNLTYNQKHKGKRRVGRGNSSGMGQTSTRGRKGQKSRSGFNIPKRFEGGQTSLIQKLAKCRGIGARKKTVSQIVNLTQIENNFKANDLVCPKTLFAKGLISEMGEPVKILAQGKITKKIKLSKCKYSKKVKQIIDALK